MAGSAVFEVIQLRWSRNVGRSEMHFRAFTRRCNGLFQPRLASLHIAQTPINVCLAYGLA